MPIYEAHVVLIAGQLIFSNKYLKISILCIDGRKAFAHRVDELAFHY
jgi:hypothetical protein